MRGVNEIAPVSKPQLKLVCKLDLSNLVEIDPTPLRLGRTHEIGMNDDSSP